MYTEEDEEENGGRGAAHAREPHVCLFFHIS